MSTFPNYSEFYAKPLVPIGKKDSVTLTSDKSSSHWLIALEGFESSNRLEVCHWKILVFRTDRTGAFEYGVPHYVSCPIPCIHKAFDVAKEIENQCRLDQFSSVQHSSNIV
ncbi:hypothetical protein LCL95_00115 [Bacillus timonensis]|nr:hypothetical protein [Bacillus timonensis]